MLCVSSNRKAALCVIKDYGLLEGGGGGGVYGVAAHVHLQQWLTEGGLGVQTLPPPPEVSKALQNRAKVNPIVKSVRNSKVTAFPSR